MKAQSNRLPLPLTLSIIVIVLIRQCDFDTMLTVLAGVLLSAILLVTLTYGQRAVDSGSEDVNKE